MRALPPREEDCKVAVGEVAREMATLSWAMFGDPSVSKRHVY